VIAGPQVRNLATVGGNLAHGDRANEILIYPTGTRSVRKVEVL
jgi:hypothetical protein